MSESGKIHLVWGDGEHDFRLRLGEWQELQTKCNAGLIEVMDRLITRKWKIEDVRETLRLGLIGGGMTPTDAFAVVKRYVDERPLQESVPAAFAVLAASVVGNPEDKESLLKGKKKSETANPIDGTDDFPSTSYMEPELPLDSPLPK